MSKKNPNVLNTDLDGASITILESQRAIGANYSSN